MNLSAESLEIDPVTLRARPSNPDAMRTFAAELAMQSAGEGDALAAARLASRAAILFVFIGETARAAPLFDFALARQRADAQLGARTVTEIRLAQLHQFTGKLATARDQLDALVQRCGTEPAARALLDFALQHLAKVRFELDDHAGALDALREALSLRRATGNGELIASTELAIDTVARALETRSTHHGGGER